MGEFKRPRARTLPDSALIPQRNLIMPAPNQFTHKIVEPTAYYYDGPEQARPPEGKLPADTPVTLLHYEGGSHCWVADGRGLYVSVAYASLAKLEI